MLGFKKGSFPVFFKLGFRDDNWLFENLILQSKDTLERLTFFLREENSRCLWEIVD